MLGLLFLCQRETASMLEVSRCRKLLVLVYADRKSVV